MEKVITQILIQLENKWHFFFLLNVLVDLNVDIYAHDPFLLL